MAILTSLLNVLLVVTSLFMICLILIQRGKGGGLAGAFGGMGGSSAFGTKAGDVFTRVTIYVAIFWGFLAMVLVYQYNRGTESAWGRENSSAVSKVKDGDGKTGTKTKDKAEPGSAKPADGGKAPAAADKAVAEPPASSLPAAIPDEPAAKK
ncbi:MAG: preprotein translocase subunit SecG [Isosphaeraceae bacterium]|nr:preprotein translocase subunit SecG [Isosphaeraceae bacterium]